MSNFEAKMHQIWFRLGLRPISSWVNLRRSPDNVAAFQRVYFKKKKGKEIRHCVFLKSWSEIDIYDRCTDNDKNIFRIDREISFFLTVRRRYFFCLVFLTRYSYAIERVYGTMCLSVCLFFYTSVTDVLWLNGAW